MPLDPIHQFEIKHLFKIGQIGDHAIYFTNSSAMRRNVLNWNF